MYRNSNIDRVIVLFFLLFIGYNSQGQDEPNMVFVKYKHGVSYVGEFVESEGDITSIRINTMDTIHINRKHLSRYFDASNAIVFRNGKYIQTKGSYWDLSFGFNALGILDSVDQRVSTHLEVMYGKRINDNVNIGVGMGFEFNEAKVAGFQFDTQFASFFAYGKYYLNRSPRRLFLFSRIGIGLASEEQQEGVTVEHSSGFNTLTGLGVHFASRKKSTFQIMLGYYTQKTDGTEFFLDNIGNEVQTNFDILIKRLIFKFGWEFG